MYHLKITLIIFATLFATGCGKKPDNYLSTGSALEKFNDLLKDQKFMVYPEARDVPVMWFDSIPERKIRETVNPSDFRITGHKNEYFVFQIVVWALKSELNDVKVEFSDLKSNRNNKIIPAKRITCLNKGGTDFRGNQFTKKIDIQAGRVQGLWVGLDLEDAAPGNYKGSVSISAGGEKQMVRVRLKVSEVPILNHGYNEGRNLSRLAWLNSTAGIDSNVTNGYIPVSLEDNTITILGRSVVIADNGLPSSVMSYFDGSNQSLVQNGEPVVSKPFRFIIEKADGEIIRLKPGLLEFSGKTPSSVRWRVLSTSRECDLECYGVMEFDGYIDYKLKLTAKVPLKVKDIRLDIPVSKEKAVYMMGLGHEGGFRAPDFKWKWDVKTKDQDRLWVGAVNGGMRIKWKAENYVSPLLNLYYEFHPLNLPPSWGNEGKGGIDVSDRNSDVFVTAYSGPREMTKGEILNYDFELLITPLKLIDRKIRFGDRYYHGGGPNDSVKIEKVRAMGANIINIHHSADINPFINYPFLDENIKPLTQFAADVHKKNMRLKLYYTTREITTKMPEFWAFNSLNGEIFFPGPGNASKTEYIYPDGPDEWHIKNLREKYIPAWFTPIKEGKFNGEVDLTVITTPDSRLNNFYVAGLELMVQNLKIDGVYIDDTALDRFALQRARKIIDSNRPEGRMDLHSWNHYRKSAGFANCLNLYMDLLPYIDMIWIGEGRDYNRSPDYWLIEVSGIPFGLTGQMLHGGGNQWRGMIYGITNRAGFKGIPPVDLWKFWDNCNIEDKMMIGYWEKDCPVKCSNPSVRATVYKGTDDVIISLANWTDHDSEVSLDIDWKKLGIDQKQINIYMPEIENFQKEQKKVGLDKIVVPGKEGYLMVINNKNSANNNRR